MIWFLAASTLVLAAALAFGGRRRGLETAAVLVASLPILRWALEAFKLPTSGSIVKAVTTAETSSLLVPIMLVWCAGTIIGLVRLMQQMRTVSRLFRCARLLPADEAASISVTLQLPATTVIRHFRMSDRRGTPMVLPTLPATVLLPEDWSQWRPRLQAGALRHEWHHVRLGDAWWHAFMHLLCLVLWFHPLAWRLAARWGDECEAGADRAAIGATDPADYADDLLSLLPSAATPPVAVALGFAQSRKSRLRRRIESLFQAPPAGSDSVPRSTFLLLIFLAVGCAWTGMREAARTELRQEAQLRLTADAFPVD